MAARPATGALRWRKSGHFRALRGDLFFWRWVGWRSGGGLTAVGRCVGRCGRGGMRRPSRRWRAAICGLGGGRRQYQSRIRRRLRRWALRRVRYAMRCSGRRASGGDSVQVRYGRVDTPINRSCRRPCGDSHGERPLARHAMRFSGKRATGGGREHVRYGRVDTPINRSCKRPSGDSYGERLRGSARHSMQRQTGQPAAAADRSATVASIRPLIAVASGHLVTVTASAP
ncbi:UNVERIFIED_ORG: hypothetical protein ABIC62_002183 [Burkholderia sp. 1595]|uniref:Uncharacterized protein n=1 Tax=Paraburkholderia terricola TaxID=169427 RepID=A0ABU1LTB6_9BURK|nr:hypothetical protein [Paraburkholderia terricola]MDR6480859.1 hypothetical protein [Paraburkholderia terricola]